MPVVELANGDVVVIGGDAEGNAPSRAVEIYSREHLPVAGYLKCLSEGRSAHSAVRLLDGRVLVTNGAIAGTSSSYAELFDPSAPTCTQAGVREKRLARLATVRAHVHAGRRHEGESNGRPRRSAPGRQGPRGGWRGVCGRRARERRDL